MTKRHLSLAFMKKLSLIAPLLLRLGINNIVVVVLYRLACRYGLFIRKMPQDTDRPTLIFRIQNDSNKDSGKFPPDSSTLDSAENLLSGYVNYFSNRRYYLGSPPDWFLNPTTGKKISDFEQHWSKLSDFDPDVGDIKCIWEVSRFDWVLVLARAYCLSGDDRFLHALNAWVSDWVLRNPLNTGPNWKCGQETGIRMIQLMLAAFLLDQIKRPTAGLIQFVVWHAERIEPTIRYAMAQDNNHGTTEATALFIAGAWLSFLGGDSKNVVKANRWLNIGRKILENRILHLVEEDGSFSQYSVNYHRVMLDTICQAEFWRNLLGETFFRDSFYRKARAATTWLYFFTNEQTGDTPNLGANDGARFFDLSSTDFRDYRPTVQLSSRLFYGKPAYPYGEYDETLHWLGIDPDEQDYNFRPIIKESTLFERGGYCYLVKNGLEVFIRFPRFKFRPGHADALHLDLWNRGINVIRDAGTYSYNTEEPWQSYFPGTRAHSTVEFDDRDQMPRISRFLFGSWLKTRNLSPIKKIDGKLTWSAGYKDYKGAEHNREVIVADAKVTIQDTLKGFRNRAVIRWRLAPESWLLKGSSCSSNIGAFKVKATIPIKRSELVEGFESRYYLEKISTPVFEIEVDQDAVVTTEVVLDL